MENRIKVVLYEDNKTLRDVIYNMINQTEDLQCIAAYSSTKHLIDNLQDSNVDVVLMDIELPGMDGIASTAILHEKFPDIKILIQTIFDNSDKIFKSLCAGASGYILKSDELSTQLQAIRDIYKGGLVMSPSIASKVLNFFTHKNVILVEPNDEDYRISSREIEILKCMQAGKKAKQISDELFISYETVRTHIKNIYKKLHVASKTEAVYKALQQGII